MRSYLTELGSSERLTQFKQKVNPSLKAGQPQHPELKANFVEVQSDYIPSYVNQKKNRNTLSKMYYDPNIFMLLHSPRNRPIYEIFEMLQIIRDCQILMVKSRFV